MDISWTLRPALAEDVEPIAELRAIVLRRDLERVGRYDEIRVRQRFRDAFVPEYMSVILVDGEFAGSAAMRPVDDGWWLEHFFVAPAVQGRGLGTAVLRTLLDRVVGEPVRLQVLRGSPARGLYERFGFVVESEDDIDVWMLRPGGND